MLPSPSAGSSIPTPSTAAQGTKRPTPASDLQRGHATPSKRHATTKASVVAGSANTNATIIGAAPIAAMSSSLASSHQMAPMTPLLVTEDQLLGRSPEQLIATILQIQAQHQQYVANISAQYESITQQLNDLRGSLAAFYNGQAATHQNAASQLQSSPQTYSEPRLARQPVPVTPILPQQPLPGPPRPPTSHPANRPSRPPPQSPQAAHTDARLLPKQPNAQAPQASGGAPPLYDYRTVGTVEEVWKEYRQGMDGQPAIEELDAAWGSRWRPEPRGRTWYSRRKVIWDKIKEFIAEGMGEDDAVREVEKLRDGGTINKLIRLLQDERKDKGVPDEGLGAS